MSDHTPDLMAAIAAMMNAKREVHEEREAEGGDNDPEASTLEYGSFTPNLVDIIQNLFLTYGATGTKRVMESVHKQMYPSRDTPDDPESDPGDYTFAQVNKMRKKINNLEAKVYLLQNNLVNTLELLKSYEQGAPVWDDESLHPNTRYFLGVLSELGALHARKSRDYGAKGDPLRNVRNSQDFGIPGWIGCMNRANDKMKRIQTAAVQTMETGEFRLANEGLIDSFRDLAVYCIIAETLFTEDQRAREIAAFTSETDEINPTEGDDF